MFHLCYTTYVYIHSMRVNDYLYLKLIVLHHVVNRFESLNLKAVNHTKGVKNRIKI